ncbi:gliding motility-associated C-terminal domain-containing protein [Belliella sp. DSM 111904]|uniref:Gliding motility-associated C-terminal domain-containing protein n=1 Tax=Belliella filtrata TaxID=2923435 RepID=A0ABS9V2W1_9BACT|nr:gliding motility-associated C-terminal domain-containing protein [Belliella filtrata]MCH7410747.1 gliding motility-associated C-terminal domain-containing protein [Belliella filtrata]
MSLCDKKYGGFVLMSLIMVMISVFDMPYVFAQHLNKDLALQTIGLRETSYGELQVFVSGKLALCSHEERGNIDLDVQGGVPPYTFKWNNNDTTQNRVNLYAGTYTVNITDFQGNKITEQIVIQPPFPLILGAIEKVDASCSSSKNGYAKISVLVGRGEPYRVEWSHGLVGGMEANDLPVGDYSVTVYDIYNCSRTVSFSIGAETSGLHIDESVTASQCGDANGSIALKVTGGREPYSYKWKHGAYSNTVNKLAAGTYEVLVTDAGGCTASKVVTVTSSDPIEIHTKSISQLTCDTTSEGSIEVEVKGGTAPYQYKWSNGANTSRITNLKAGKYRVEAIDANGCMTSTEFEMKQVAYDLTVNVVQLGQVSCHGAADGVVELMVEQAQESVRIRWSDGFHDQWKRDGLTAGTYTAVLEDATGCKIEHQVNIQEPLVLKAKIDSSLEMNCDTGELTGISWVDISGGVPPYTVKWSNGETNSKEIKFYSATEIRIEVTDANGCMTSDLIKVDFPTFTGSARVDFEYRKLAFVSDPEVLVNDSIAFTSYMSNEFILWEWDFGDGKVSSEKDPIHSFAKEGAYTVKLTAFDVYGCSTFEANTLHVSSSTEVVVMPNAFSPNGDGLNDRLKPVLKGIKHFQMDVFNHWGEHIYSENGLEVVGWDGTYKGKLLPAGNYVYKISYSRLDDNVVNQTGAFTLIR